MATRTRRDEQQSIFASPPRLASLSPLLLLFSSHTLPSNIPHSPLPSATLSCDSSSISNLAAFNNPLRARCADPSLRDPPTPFLAEWLLLLRHHTRPGARQREQQKREEKKTFLPSSIAKTRKNRILAAAQSPSVQASQHSLALCVFPEPLLGPTLWTGHCATVCPDGARKARDARHHRNHTNHTSQTHTTHAQVSRRECSQSRYNHGASSALCRPRYVSCSACVSFSRTAHAPGLLSFLLSQTPSSFNPSTIVHPSKPPNRTVATGLIAV